MTRSMIGLAGLAGLLAACSAETEMADATAAAGSEMPAETMMADTTQDVAETVGDASDAVTTVDIREWPVPWEGRPRDP